MISVNSLQADLSVVLESKGFKLQMPLKKFKAMSD